MLNLYFKEPFVIIGVKLEAALKWNMRSTGFKLEQRVYPLCSNASNHVKSSSLENQLTRIPA